MKLGHTRSIFSSIECDIIYMIMIRATRNTVLFLVIFTGGIFSSNIQDLFGASASSPSSGSLIGLCSCLPDTSCKDKNMEKLIQVISTVKKAVEKYKSVGSDCIDSNTLINMGLVPPTVGTECLDLWLNSINPFKVLTETNTPKLAEKYNTCEEFHKSLLGMLNLRLTGGYNAIENYLATKAQPSPMSSSCLGTNPLRSPFDSMGGMGSMCGAGGMSSMGGMGGYMGNLLPCSSSSMGEFGQICPQTGSSSLIDTLASLKANSQCACSQDGQSLFGGSNVENTDINVGGMNIVMGGCCDQDLTTVMANAIKQQRKKRAIAQASSFCPVNSYEMKSVLDSIRAETMKEVEISRKKAEFDCYPQTKVSMSPFCGEGGASGSSPCLWNTNLGVPSGLGLELGSCNNQNIGLLDTILRNRGLLFNSMGPNGPCTGPPGNKQLTNLTAMQTFGCSTNL